MKNKLNKAQKQIPQKQTIAIIGEGTTEKHYFDQLKDNEKIRLDKKNLTILPKKAPSKGYKCTEIIDKAMELIEEYDYDYIFCVIDYDTICDFEKNKENFEGKLSELDNFCKEYNENSKNVDNISIYSFPENNLSLHSLKPNMVHSLT